MSRDEKNYFCKKFRWQSLVWQSFISFFIKIKMHALQLYERIETVINFNSDQFGFSWNVFQKILFNYFVEQTNDESIHIKTIFVIIIVKNRRKKLYSLDIRLFLSNAIAKIHRHRISHKISYILGYICIIQLSKNHLYGSKFNKNVVSNFFFENH